MEPTPGAPAVSPAFARRWRERCGAAPGVGSFADFMEVALYDAEVGYYRTKRARIGRTPEADFYTSSSLSAVFGRLVQAAATALLPGTDPASLEFVEIGAEPDTTVLAGVEHPFGRVRAIRVGDPLDLRKPAVVFSNELFDAQPFRRVVFRGGWCELGVALDGDGVPVWTELPALSAPVAAICHELPETAPDGYVIDLPLAAAELARRIAAQPWTGLFLAFDYGRTWQQLVTEYPAGTARAYARHRQHADLLAQPGEQDLTCHVCWDWIEAALRAGGFAPIARESQEAFFVRRATAEIDALFQRDRDPLSPRRTQLKHLLHPALLGQRFEALWAIRQPE